jgi:multiple sugar transport system ATP-binding protein
LQPHSGEQLTVGLRPERLRLAPATNRNLPAQVLQVEALGNEFLVACRLEEGDASVQVRADPRAAVQPGESVHLEVDPSGWCLFNAAGYALAKELPAQSPRLELPSFSG